MPDPIPTFEEMQARREEVSLHDWFGWFFRTYAPEDPEMRWRFESDLTPLFRRIYTDAQAPFIKQISTAMALQPLPMILKDAPATTSGKD